jgi:hypothetical protein
VFETVILQATAHTWIRQRIVGSSAYFDYVRVADTINSHKSEDRDIADKKKKNVKTAGDNQSAANAITNIFLPHK